MSSFSENLQFLRRTIAQQTFENFRKLKFFLGAPKMSILVCDLVKRKPFFLLSLHFKLLINLNKTSPWQRLCKCFVRAHFRVTVNIFRGSAQSKKQYKNVKFWKTISHHLLSARFSPSKITLPYISS